MGVVTTVVPAAGTRMTLDDWLALSGSDDRVELIAGVVAVSSSPTEPYQAIVTGLVMALAPDCPPEFRVRVGPLGVLVRDLASGLLPTSSSYAPTNGATLDRLPVPLKCCRAAPAAGIRWKRAGCTRGAASSRTG